MTSKLRKFREKKDINDVVIADLSVTNKSPKRRWGHQGSLKKHKTQSNANRCATPIGMSLRYTNDVAVPFTKLIIHIMCHDLTLMNHFSYKHAVPCGQVKLAC